MLFEFDSRTERVLTVEYQMEIHEGLAPNIIFFTDNGHGLGHVTRLMAVAKQARGRFNPIFLTMSLGFPLLRDAGFVVEYFPSYATLDMTRIKWDPLFLSRLTEMVVTTNATTVVVDHVNPGRSFGWLRETTTDVEFIWLRRGLWKEGRNREGISRANEFDLVVEPGDFAGPTDIGLTAEYRRGIVSIPPVVLVEPHELLPREDARAALGIPQTGKAVLIQLTHSEPASLETMIRRTRSVLAGHVGEEALHCFAPLHPLHRGQLSRIDGVSMRPVYPIAQYLRAFDGVVTTAGYNSFHEVALSGVPAVFVPRETSSIDDQARRARFAELCGRAFWAPSVEHGKFVTATGRMLEPGEQNVAAEVARELGPADGASELAEILAHRSNSDRGSRARSSSGPSSRPAGRNWRYSEVKGDVDVVLVDALALSEQRLRSAMANERELDGVGSDSLPVVFAYGNCADPLTQSGVPFETVMTESEWTGVCTGQPYSTYLANRFERGMQRYGASRIVELG